MTCSCGYAHNPESATNCKLCGQPLATGASGPRPGGRRGEPTPEAREHRLVAEGSPPLRLTPDTVLMIGRAVDCGLPIPSQRVSRHHAEIAWRAGLPFLRHLSETQSTLVNGKAVKEHELRDGDQIQIGPYQCTYRVRAEGATQKLEPSAGGGATIVDQGGEALTGSLAEMSAFSLLRSFEVRGQTGTLVLRSGSQEGTMVLDKGKLTSVTLEDQSGKKALFRLLSWGEGTYSFSLEKKAPAGKIFRTFNYAAVGPADTNELKGTISDLLEEAQDAGVEEPLPPASKPPARPAAPPQRAQTGRPGVPPRKGPPGRPGEPPAGLRRPPPPGPGRPK